MGQVAGDFVEQAIEPVPGAQAAPDEPAQAEPLSQPESPSADFPSEPAGPEGAADDEVSAAPASPTYEAAVSPNADGTYTVSLSVTGSYLSRTVFGKTTLDYTKGAGITCSLSKWVHGTGVHDEPAGFTYTKTDASGQTGAWEGAPQAMVYEDGTLVWGVGSLDPHGSVTMEPDVTYTVSFEVAARDVAYADFASRDPEVPDHNYPVFALATLQYLQMQEKTGSVTMGFDGLADYNQVYVPVTQGPSAPSVGGGEQVEDPGEPGGAGEADRPAQPGGPAQSGDATQPEPPAVDAPAATETVRPASPSAAPAAARGELPKTADSCDCTSLPAVFALIGGVLVGAAGALAGKARRLA